MQVWNNTTAVWFTLSQPPIAWKLKGQAAESRSDCWHGKDDPGFTCILHHHSLWGQMAVFKPEDGAMSVLQQGVHESGSAPRQKPVQVKHCLLIKKRINLMAI